MNVISSLVLFDLKAFRNSYLKVLAANLIATNLFHFRYYPWDVYFMSVCMILSVLYYIPIYVEQKLKLEMLKCSLPATRSDIVFSRYLTSFIIIGIGIFLFYINAFVADFLYTNQTAYFDQFNHVKILYMITFLISIHGCIFLPSVFIFRLMSTIITFTIAIIIAIVTTVIIFHPDKNSFVHYFQPEDSFQILILTIFTVLLIIGSMILSIKLYKRKEL
jgi:ABC-type transport system involved in multi-copper enzyme maturation permease subunit